MRYLLSLLVIVGAALAMSFTEKPEATKETFETLMPPDEPTIAENAVVATYGSYPQSGFCGEWHQTTQGSGIWQKTCTYCTYAGCIECTDTVVIVNGVPSSVQRSCLAP